MKIDIIVPAAGESVTEADIASWSKDDGEFVEMDDVLLELETDKASMELNAEGSGILTIVKEEGETVIKLIVHNDNKKLAFELEKTRKFDLSTFNQVKNKQYVKKISF